MIQVKTNTVIPFVISTAFLLASTSAIAEYSQTQNKIDDRQDKVQQSQSNAYKKKSEEEKSGSSSSENRDRDTSSSTGTYKKKNSPTDKKGNY